MKTIFIGLVAMIGGGLIYGTGKDIEGIALTAIGLGIIIGRIGAHLGKV